MTRGEVYLQAAQLIETRGLFVGWYEGPDGSLDVVGALRTVVFGDAGPIPLLRAWDDNAETIAARDLYLDVMVDLGVYLDGTHDPVYADTGGQIVAWSDRSTQEHVVRTLRAAAGVKPPAFLTACGPHFGDAMRLAPKICMAAPQLGPWTLVIPGTQVLIAKRWVTVEDIRACSMDAAHGPMCNLYIFACGEAGTHADLGAEVWMRHPVVTVP